VLGKWRSRGREEGVDGRMRRNEEMEKWRNEGYLEALKENMIAGEPGFYFL